MSTTAQSAAEGADRLAEIRAVHAWIRSATAELTQEQVRAAIELPGWTRAHVMVHLGDLSRAFARQARYALRGETIEVYDGGRPTRDKSIEENHGRDVAWLREHLATGLTDIEDAWAELSLADWDLPCEYRKSPLIATQFAWWREAELHGVDLGLGRRAEDWSPALAAHVVTFLQPRLPESVGLTATDADASWQPDAETVITGPLTALAAWISGRPSAATPTATPPGPLPELNAWP